MCSATKKYGQNVQKYCKDTNTILKKTTTKSFESVITKLHY